ncbi:hypothetical protein M514_08604 [Trichuris suis]|uniref:Uncharacterized protein n=1 Tax=Trichuris suis TaxID=68888 RepID=A0A085N1T6_9BILA|nr:hypothetical protein M513_08604 [Trichuris suis]KFD63432.1 hypothetical protein M514_08604 [Trichuris suis]
MAMRFSSIFSSARELDPFRVPMHSAFSIIVRFTHPASLSAQRKRPVGQATCRSNDVSAKRPVGQTTIRPNDLSVERPVGQTTCQPNDLSAQRPVGQTTCRPYDLSAKRLSAK